MKSKVLAACFLATSMFASACDADDSSKEFLDTPLPNEVIVTEVNGERLVTFREEALNTFTFNTFTVNGFTVNGFTINGADFTEWLLNEAPDIVHANVDDDGEFSVTTPGGYVKTPNQNDVVKVSFKVDGVKYRLKISEFENLPGTNLQYMRLRWKMPNEADSQFEDACVDAAGNPVKALLLDAEWDPETAQRVDGSTQESWACRGAAIAKAIEWGFFYDGEYNGVALAPYHQALLHLIRADYGYDGTPHTENGTLIDLRDNLGIHEWESSMSLEAVWGEDGLLCLNNPRKTNWDGATLRAAYGIPECDTQPLSHWEAQDWLFMTRSTPTDPTT